MSPKILAAVLAVAAAISPATLLAQFVVTNTNDAGAGSLRQAILDANGHSGTITFSIGSGVQTIQPLSELPLAPNVSIDGSTQPGYSGTPLIVIDGSLLPALSTCLQIGGYFPFPPYFNATFINAVISPACTGTTVARVRMA